MDKHEYKELSSLAANGDAKSFSKLYETIYGAMYYTAFYSLSTEADSIEAVLGAARDGFNAINRLHTEEAFRVFMLKTLCARIRTFFKDYGDSVIDKDYGSEIKNALFTLDNLDRICAVMSVAAKLSNEEISLYTGLSRRSVKKRVSRALEDAPIIGDSGTRREMSHKVVPEDVLPVNIVNLLIDDTAELPEPDAFTFLTRLRDLGIGSADFLYLLDGCGAPERAVEKIRENPAMSLQGLILTLENSGMTGEDYTRILYTARQIWERTLTMRIESAERLSERESPDEIDETEQPEDFAEPEETAEAPEPADEEPADEPSFTEVFDKVNEELTNSLEADSSFTGKFDRMTDELINPPEEPIPIEEPAFETAEEPSPEPIEEPAEPSGYNGDTTAIIKLDAEQIREELAKLGEESEKSSDSEGGVPSESEELFEEFEEHSPYHKRALLAGGVGAAVVIACGAVAGLFFEPRGAVSYAADADEVFLDVYNAYYAEGSEGVGIAGGERVCAFPEGECSAFGDLLISSDGLGVFSDNNFIYDVGYETITVNLLQDGDLTAKELLPPESSRFVAAFDDGGALIAVFSGNQSGFMRIDDGKAQYTAYQDGVLTDYRADDGSITLATVYTPIFTRSFSVNDTYMYLPKFYLDTTDSQPVVSPKNVILSGTVGYSYAVNITYKTADGAAVSETAVIGNPLCASADGRCVMNGEDGMILEMGKSPSFVKCGKAELAAFHANGTATLENDIVHIRDKNGNVTAKVENLAAKPEFLRFAGDYLLIGDALILDCRDFKNPKTAELKNLSGAIRASGAGSAIALEYTGSSVTLTRYALEGDKAKAEDSVSVDVTIPEGSSPRLIANTAVFTEDCCGVAFTYFDGVSVVSRFELFGKSRKSLTLYDDKTGFTSVFSAPDGRIYAVSYEQLHDILK